MKQRTIFTAIGISLISIISLNAQNFKFGVQTGVDIVNTRIIPKPDENNDYSRDLDPMISFNLNGYLGYKGNSFIGISAEPGFIQKGGLMNGAGGSSIRYQLNYIQFPILADIFIMDKLFLSVGPEFSYMINAKEKPEGNNDDISDFYKKKFELSGLLGLNYCILKNVDIGLRYNHGLTYISGDPIQDSSPKYKYYNQYIQFLIRFKI